MVRHFVSLSPEVQGVRSRSALYAAEFHAATGVHTLRTMQHQAIEISNHSTQKDVSRLIDSRWPVLRSLSASVLISLETVFMNWWYWSIHVLGSSFSHRQATRHRHQQSEEYNEFNFHRRNCRFLEGFLYCFGDPRNFNYQVYWTTKDCGLPRAGCIFTTTSNIMLLQFNEMSHPFNQYLAINMKVGHASFSSSIMTASE